MENTIIISCKTLEAELLHAMKNTGVEYPVAFIESGLHERPKKLASAVSDLFNAFSGERILMLLGQCGNSLIGIAVGDFELVMPKVDDCLSLLIGSTTDKMRIGSEDKAFFLTDGWLQGESTIMSQYEKSVEKYGEDTAVSILEMMYGHYSTLGLIDTGTTNMNSLYEKTNIVAKLLGLKRTIYKGTVKYIEDLITGPWDNERFIIKNPHEIITMHDYI